MRRMIHSTVTIGMAAVFFAIAVAYARHDAGRACSRTPDARQSQAQAASSAVSGGSACQDSAARRADADHSDAVSHKATGRPQPTLAPPAAAARTTYGQVIEVSVQVEQVVLSPRTAEP